MGDWADTKATELLWKLGKYMQYREVETGDNVVQLIAAALRDAAADSRRNAIERSAELIGRQVEPRDA